MLAQFMLKFIDEYYVETISYMNANTKCYSKQTHKNKNQITKQKKLPQVSFEQWNCVCRHVRKSKEKQTINRKSSIYATKTSLSNAVSDVSTSTLKFDAFWRFCFQLQIEVYKHSKM